MVQQLTVYDESGAHVGMTFPKRARQLINKQRALWHNDEHTAIRLLPDAKEDTTMDAYLDEDLDETIGVTGSDELLLYLARKNVREKRNLLRHVLAYIATWPMIGIFYAAIIESTRHPSYWRLRQLGWQVENLREYVPIESQWILSDIYSWGQRTIDSLLHPIMLIIFGIMIAWGAWILYRVVKRRTATSRVRVRKLKPDPVQLEYQRLKDMNALR